MKIPIFGRKVRPWTPAEDKLLGTQTDAVIAGQLRRSAVDVRWRRRTLGLKTFADGCEKPWVEFELRLLGTATDQKIAQRLGRMLQTVRYKRRRLKIPAVV